MLFQECFTFVSNMFPGSSKQVLRVFQGTLEEFSRFFKNIFEGRCSLLESLLLK